MSFQESITVLLALIGVLSTIAIFRIRAHDERSNYIINGAVGTAFQVFSDGKLERDLKYITVEDVIRIAGLAVKKLDGKSKDDSGHLSADNLTKDQLKEDIDSLKIVKQKGVDIKKYINRPFFVIIILIMVSSLMLFFSVASLFDNDIREKLNFIIVCIATGFTILRIYNLLNIEYSKNSLDGFEMLPWLYEIIKPR